MANPQNVEFEAAKFSDKFIQDSKDEPIKLARKLFEILHHMRSSGKENSMPYQVISRAMETVIKQNGIDNEALMSLRNSPPGARLGESGSSQVAEEDMHMEFPEEEEKRIADSAHSDSERQPVNELGSSTELASPISLSRARTIGNTEMVIPRNTFAFALIQHLPRDSKHTKLASQVAIPENAEVKFQSPAAKHRPARAQSAVAQESTQIKDSLREIIAMGEYCSNKGEKLLRFRKDLAACEFEKAAIAYRIAKSWDLAGDRYLKSAIAHLETWKHYKAAKAYVAAGYCLKGANSKGARLCFEKAVEVLIYIKRRPKLENRIYYWFAVCHKEIANLHMEEENLHLAIGYYEAAAELKANSICGGNLWRKVAQVSSLLGDYMQAIEIYEIMATALIELKKRIELEKRSKNRKELLVQPPFSAKESLLDAGICQLCKGGVAAIKKALVAYMEMDRSFSKTFEFRLLADLATAIRDADLLRFTEAVSEYNGITQLSAGNETLLERVKEDIKDMKARRDAEIQNAFKQQRIWPKLFRGSSTSFSPVLRGLLRDKRGKMP